MKKIFIFFIFLLFIPLQCFALKKVNINIMQWDGYLTPFFSGFIELAAKNGYEVKINEVKPPIIDHENTFERIREGGVDFATPSSYFFQARDGRIFNLLEPLDWTKVSNAKYILPKLKGPYSTYNKKKYGIPFTAGTYGLAYNASKVSEPKSWAVLWEESNKNNYTIYQEAFQNIFMTNLLFGKNVSDAFDYEKSNIKLLNEKLTQLVKNAKSIWSGYTNDMDTMNSLNYVTTWGYDIIEANKKGGHWKIAHPKEGEFVWLDDLILSKSSATDEDKVKLFYLFCNYILSPEVQAKMMRSIGSVPVNIETRKLATPEEIKDFHIGDDSFIQDKKIFDTLDKRTEKGFKAMWDKILKVRENK